MTATVELPDEQAEAFARLCQRMEISQDKAIRQALLNFIAAGEATQ